MERTCFLQPFNFSVPLTTSQTPLSRSFGYRWHHGQEQRVPAVDICYITVSQSKYEIPARIDADFWYNVMPAVFSYRVTGRQSLSYGFSFPVHNQYKMIGSDREIHFLNIICGHKKIPAVHLKLEIEFDRKKIKCYCCSIFRILFPTKPIPSRDRQGKRRVLRKDGVISLNI